MKKLNVYKKAQAISLTLVLVIAAVAVGVWYFTKQSGTGQGLSIEKASDQAKEEQVAQSCNGIASVKYLYDDKNKYSVGTDPGTNVTLYSPAKKMISDDATSSTVATLSTHQGIAGNTNGVPDSNYFAELISTKTACADTDVQPELVQKGAPTLTAVNDNGVTINANSAAGNQTVAQNDEYDFTLTVKSPSQKCSSKHGAVVAVEYDATYVRGIKSNLDSYTGSVLVAHGSSSAGATATWDQWAAFVVPGELCNSNENKPTVTVQTVNSAPVNDGANVKVHWLPLNYDINARSFAVIGPSLYDEDNNLISIGGTTLEIFTSD